MTLADPLAPHPAFALVNPDADPSLILVCDHASNHIPAEYRGLGLGEAELSRHIAYDIGAAEVTRDLARMLGAPAVLAQFSRLLIDANRGIDDPTLVMKLSDGAIIPGNARADEAEVARRVARFHVPYHGAISALIGQARARGVLPVLVSIHSFTPQMKGFRRPWSYGVLWDKDGRLALPLIGRLRREHGLIIGDNEPYSGELEGDCMNVHGTRNGLAHALIEIRQDLIETEAGTRDVARMLARVLPDALAAMRAHTSPGGSTMDNAKREAVEAAVFRRLVEHLQSRTDVQNIELMTTAGFCRNCLGDWYKAAAAGLGETISLGEARARVYGMAQAEWKAKYQRDATPEQLAAFEKAQKHS